MSGLLVAANHLRGVPAVGLRDYRNLVGIGDDTVVGDDLTGRPDYKSGAARHGFLGGFTELVRDALPACVPPSGSPPAPLPDRDVDNRRRSGSTRRASVGNASVDLALGLPS